MAVLQADSKQLVAGIVAVLGGLAVARKLRRSTSYILHVYDHCPFCNRVEYLMQQHSIPYERVLYGYGAGANPDKCGGQGYDPAGGPLHLTGKKMLPVLEGPGVPCAGGAKGMPESMEICAYLIGKHKLVAPCESGREDLKQFTAELMAFKPDLTEHRMVRMPILDWADPRDVRYRRYKKKLPLEPPPVVDQPELVAKLNAKLAELPALLRGGSCLNEWGWGMDDVVLLPLLRVFTCVKGARFPPEAAAYLTAGASQMIDYEPHAL